MHTLSSSTNFRNAQTTDNNNGSNDASNAKWKMIITFSSMLFIAGVN